MARVIYEGHSSRDHQRLVQCFLVVDTFPGTRGQRVALQGCIYLNNSDSFAQSHLYHVLVFPWKTGELFTSVPLISPNGVSSGLCRRGALSGSAAPLQQTSRVFLWEMRHRVLHGLSAVVRVKALEGMETGKPSFTFKVLLQYFLGLYVSSPHVSKTKCIPSSDASSNINFYMKPLLMKRVREREKKCHLATSHYCLDNLQNRLTTSSKSI